MPEKTRDLTEFKFDKARQSFLRIRELAEKLQLGFGHNIVLYNTADKLAGYAAGAAAIEESDADYSIHVASALQDLRQTFNETLPLFSRYQIHNTAENRALLSEVAALIAKIRT